MAEPKAETPHPWRAAGRPPFDLGVLQAQQAAWREYNFPDQKPYQALLGVGEEAGELMHAHLKHEQGIRGFTYANYVASAYDAIGDIVIYLASYCNMNGLSLEEAVWATWREVRRRDWIKYPNDGVTS